MDLPWSGHILAAVFPSTQTRASKLTDFFWQLPKRSCRSLSKSCQSGLFPVIFTWLSLGMTAAQSSSDIPLSKLLLMLTRIKEISPKKSSVFDFERAKSIAAEEESTSTKCTWLNLCIPVCSLSLCSNYNTLSTRATKERRWICNIWNDIGYTASTHFPRSPNFVEVYKLS